MSDFFLYFFLFLQHIDGNIPNPLSVIFARKSFLLKVASSVSIKRNVISFTCRQCKYSQIGITAKFAKIGIGSSFQNA